jgi:hypothetical protein
VIGAKGFVEMRHGTLVPVALVLLGLAEAADVVTGRPSVAAAQACEALPAGPEQTECFVGRARVAGAKSAAAAAAARQAGDAAILVNKTGTSVLPKTRRAKAKRGRQ